jgi:hypothetical protein
MQLDQGLDAFTSAKTCLCNQEVLEAARAAPPAPGGLTAAQAEDILKKCGVPFAGSGC